MIEQIMDVNNRLFSHFILDTDREVLVQGDWSSFLTSASLVRDQDGLNRAFTEHLYNLGGTFVAFVEANSIYLDELQDYAWNLTFNEETVVDVGLLIDTFVGTVKKSLTQKNIHV
jgi:hypothetical protein